MSPRWRRFRGGPDDTLVVSLSLEELTLLRELPDVLREAFDAPPGDPASERLFPQAHLEPSEAQAEEWRAMVHPDLLRQRLDALELLSSSFARVTVNGEWREIALTPDDVQAWLGVLNDTRLVIGTRLGVTEDEDEVEVDPESPEAQPWAIYYWLTHLQGDLIDQLLT